MTTPLPSAPASTELCGTCTAWCSTTEKQLANRLANMRNAPGGQPYPCPQCDSIAWATTREMIGEGPVEHRSRWQFLLNWFRGVA